MKKKNFELDDIELNEGRGPVGGDESNEKMNQDQSGDLFDHVCAICDNGGEVLCCEGSCMRSFHPTVADGAESFCKTLGLTADEIEEIQNFFCNNCRYKLHQCFGCGRLGSSDKSSGAEVFKCISATCGHFYHPQCVATLLHAGDTADAQELQKRISSGESFTCPIHKCHICKERENKEVYELQFAVCRRCPRSYHRKCLPRKIAFAGSKEEGIIQRAWDGLLPNHILIYCLKHKIEEELATPIRNHVIFPDIEGRKDGNPSELRLDKNKFVAKKQNIVSEDQPGEIIAGQTSTLAEKIFIIGSDSTKQIERDSSGKEFDCLKKRKINDLPRESLNYNFKCKLKKVVGCSRVDKGKLSLGERSSSSECTQFNIHRSRVVKTTTIKPVMKTQVGSPPLVDSEMEKRITDLMKRSASSVNVEDIREKPKVPSTHAYSLKNLLDETITEGKIEAFVQAVRAALQKLEEGCSIEDAKAVCGPGVLGQLIKWKSKFSVYLAPFLHGNRYTSFGRHFTKLDKLKEIVNKLHWYVQEGDMIVDFCCGANDFSWLMKEKLEETGKKCFFKNYDLIQPKNDFNFEKKDWMTVSPKELPPGSQLIMGLNPPFGVKAALANKFIDKALEFKPKLLILIVPKETERLDAKNAAYNLVWEDGEKLSGKSFYLPGSVDVNDKQMEQWNLKPPPLYLWSHPDWSAWHNSIAQKHGHTSKKLNPRKEIRGILHKKRFLQIHDSKVQQGDFDNKYIGESHKNLCCGNNHYKGLERQKKEKVNEAEPGGKPDDHFPSQVSQTNEGASQIVKFPFDQTDPRSLLEIFLSESLPEREVSTESLQHIKNGLSGSGSELGTCYGLIQNSNAPGDLYNEAEKYTLNMPDPITHGTAEFVASGSLARVPALGTQCSGLISDAKDISQNDELKYYRRDEDQYPYSSQRSCYSPFQNPGQSTILQHATRLGNELNLSGTDNSGLVGRVDNINIYYGAQGFQPAFHADSLSFSSGPKLTLSHNSSSG